MTHELVAEDLRLAQRIAQHVAPNDCDVESAAMAGLLKASQKWNGMGSWRAFAASAVRWAIFDHLRKPRHEVAVDLNMLPDTAVPIGAQPDEETPEIVIRLRVQLCSLHAEYLLDGVDRRRLGEDELLAHLREVLS